MGEPTTAENKKQARQKPPLSVGRIAGEILAGAGVGLAVSLSLALLTGRVLVEKGVCFEEFVILIIFVIVFPPLYGFVGAAGVYLVGTRGGYTGSFLVTLAGGFIGGFGMLIMLPLALFGSGARIAGVENIILCVIAALTVLSPPVFATLGFNLTRRYKKPPSS